MRTGLCLLAAGSFAAHYLLFSRHLLEHQYLQEFWQTGFMPTDSLSAVPKWLVSSMASVCYLPFGTTSFWATSALVALGTVAAARRGLGPFALTIGGLLVALIAAMAHCYPFDDRLLVFGIPGLLIAMALGAGWILSLQRRWISWALMLLLAWMLAEPAGQAVEHLFRPRMNTHIRPVLQYVDAHAEEGDTVGIMGAYGSSLYDYYERFMQFPGRCRVERWPTEPSTHDATIRQLQDLRPRRVWLVFADSGVRDKHYPPALLRKLTGHGEVSREYRQRATFAVLFEMRTTEQPR